MSQAGQIVLLLFAMVYCRQAAAQLPTTALPTAVVSGQDVGVNATGPPQHPATDDQIREYLALTGTVKVMHTMLSQQVAAMRATSAPYLIPAFWDDMNSEFLKVDFVSYCLPIYQKFLSTEDMGAILLFYRSPAGQRILATQQPIGQEAQLVLRKVGEDIGRRVYEKHKEEIDAAKSKFDEGSSSPLKESEPKH